MEGLASKLLGVGFFLGGGRGGGVRGFLVFRALPPEPPKPEHNLICEPHGSPAKLHLYSFPKAKLQSQKPKKEHRGDNPQNSRLSDPRVSLKPEWL